MLLSYDFKCGMKKKVVPTWNLFILYHIKAKNANVLQQIICKNKLKYKHDSAYYVNIYIYIYIYIVQETEGFFHLHGGLPTLADYCIGQKKSQQITYTGG